MPSQRRHGGRRQQQGAAAAERLAAGPWPLDAASALLRVLNPALHAGTPFLMPANSAPPTTDIALEGAEQQHALLCSPVALSTLLPRERLALRSLCSVCLPCFLGFLSRQPMLLMSLVVLFQTAETRYVSLPACQGCSLRPKAQTAAPPLHGAQTLASTHKLHAASISAQRFHPGMTEDDCADFESNAREGKQAAAICTGLKQPSSSLKFERGTRSAHATLKLQAQTSVPVC